MRAWVLDEGADTYRLDDVPEPAFGPWDVRVAMRTSALNHLDLWVARGMPKPPSYPHVPGADGAGVVTDVGQAIEDCPRAPRSSSIRRPPAAGVRPASQGRSPSARRSP